MCRLSVEKARERAEGAQKERCDWSDWTDGAEELQNGRARMRASRRQRFVSEDGLRPYLPTAVVGRGLRANK